MKIKSGSLCLRLAALLSLTALSVSCGNGSGVNQEAGLNSLTDSCLSETDSEKLDDQLKACIPNLSIVSSTQSDDNKILKLKFTQQVDHDDPTKGTFEQTLHLRHRNYNRPMVLATTGYSMYTTKEFEPTKLLNGNQLIVEHRHFAESTPAGNAWETLNIRQSAADFHAITESFKKLYKAKWVNTGASKGGMTSVYHRRFYPNDLDATIAYVAPHSFSDDDTRFLFFLEEVGGDEFAACRTKLANFQVEAMKRKADLAKLAEGSFERLGGVEGAIEVTISEFRFVFWQYQPHTRCNAIPETDVSDEVMFKFLDSVMNMASSYGDSGINFFQSYFLQAAEELGGPAPDFEFIANMVEHPASFGFDLLVPQELSPKHNPLVMHDVDDWVQNDSERVLYVYGEFDPWSAGAYRMGSSRSRDSHLMVAPKMHHGSKISTLNADDRAQAADLLANWMEVDKESIVGVLTDLNTKFQNTFGVDAAGGSSDKSATAGETNDEIRGVRP